MFIDIHVHPAFYEPINRDPRREELRHEALNIHKNGTAPLEHIFNQMRCAGLDKLCLLPEDYTSTVGCAVWWIWRRTSSSALPAWTRFSRTRRTSWRTPFPA